MMSVGDSTIDGGTFEGEKIENKSNHTISSTETVLQEDPKYVEIIDDIYDCHLSSNERNGI